LNETENEIAAAEEENAKADEVSAQTAEENPCTEDEAQETADTADETAAETASAEPAEEPEEESGKLEKLSRGFNVFLSVFTALMVGFIAYIMVCSAKGKPVNVFGRSLLTVVTGSMEPSLHTGDYIYVKKVPADELEVGDVITFRSEEGDVSGKLVTHRINEITPEGDFITKGDANTIADSKRIRQDQIIGKYTGKAKFFKWINSFADRRKLLLILVIIPMTLIALYEVRTISKLGETVREKQEADSENMEKLMREAIDKEKERLAREEASAEKEVVELESGKTDEG
jgi:signal peptidase I